MPQDVAGVEYRATLCLYCCSYALILSDLVWAVRIHEAKFLLKLSFHFALKLTLIFCFVLTNTFKNNSCKRNHNFMHRHNCTSC